MAQPSERYRDAARLGQRHEVLPDAGWKRVRAVGTLRFRSGRRIVHFQFAGGDFDDVELPDQVMSRLAARGDATAPAQPSAEVMRSAEEGR